MQDGGVLGIARVVLRLRVDVCEAGQNRIQLVAADAPIDDLLDAIARVESPPATFFHERKRKWPLVVADQQNRSIGTVFGDSLSAV